jgi:transposase
MDYFASLDISMDETHVCVVDREGVVARPMAATRADARFAHQHGQELFKLPGGAGLS